MLKIINPNSIFHGGYGLRESYQLGFDQNCYLVWHNYHRNHQHGVDGTGVGAGGGDGVGEDSENFRWREMGFNII